MGNTELWLAQYCPNRPRIRITEGPLCCTAHFIDAIGETSTTLTEESCIDMPEDGLITGRNMQHTRKGNKFN